MREFRRYENGYGTVIELFQMVVPVVEVMIIMVMLYYLLTFFLEHTCNGLDVRPACLFPPLRGGDMAAPACAAKTDALIR